MNPGASVAATRSSLAGSTVSRPSAETSSPRWSPVGVATISVPPGTSTRANSGPLRGAKTFISTDAVPSAIGNPDHASASTAPIRGCARAARRSAGLDTSTASPTASGWASRTAARWYPTPAPTSTTSPSVGGTADASAAATKS